MSPPLCSCSPFPKVQFFEELLRALPIDEDDSITHCSMSVRYNLPALNCICLLKSGICRLFVASVVDGAQRLTKKVLAMSTLQKLKSDWSRMVSV